MKRLSLFLLFCTLLACDKTRGMDTRTFELSRLSQDQALTLLTPYIREGGNLSGKDRLITVREKPDRIKLIEDILKKYDGLGEVYDVALHLQVVQADGFAGRDSAIADVEPMLRQTFRYQGYRLVGETQVRVREEGSFEQSLQKFTIQGHAHRVTQFGNEKRLPLEIMLRITHNGEGLLSGEGMGTTITTTLGKPTVLGQSTQSGAIILIIRPSLAAM